MSIEVTCHVCGEEFDSRHARCPACPWAIGTKVAWSSQSAGIVKEKRGVVYAVILAGTQPTRPMGIRHPGASRYHTSYVIAVARGGRKTGRMYWPRMAHLRRVDEDE